MEEIDLLRRIASNMISMIEYAEMSWDMTEKSQKTFQRFECCWAAYAAIEKVIGTKIREIGKYITPITNIQNYSAYLKETSYKELKFPEQKEREMLLKPRYALDSNIHPLTNNIEDLFPKNKLTEQRVWDLLGLVGCQIHKHPLKTDSALLPNIDLRGELIKFYEKDLKKYRSNEQSIINCRRQKAQLKEEFEELDKQYNGKFSKKKYNGKFLKDILSKD